MTNPASDERKIDGNPSSTLRDRSRFSASTSSQPLPVAEIESLLNLARENVGEPGSGNRDEDIGPGDVQYFRGDSLPTTHNAIAITAGSPTSDWLETSRNLDSTISRAEQYLAAAILNDNHDSTAPTRLANEFAKVSVESNVKPRARDGLTFEDLADVELDISIEFGRTEILIEDVLKLREGSVVALDKLAGDPVDIVANGRLVARGELLVIDGKFGVRLSEVL